MWKAATEVNVAPRLKANGCLRSMLPKRSVRVGIGRSWGITSVAILVILTMTVFAAKPAAAETGDSWSVTLPSGSCAAAIAATPDGGVAAELESTCNAVGSVGSLQAFSATGSSEWTAPLADSLGVDDTALEGSGGQPPILTDPAGDLYWIQEDSPSGLTIQASRTGGISWSLPIPGESAGLALGTNGTLYAMTSVGSGAQGPYQLIAVDRLSGVMLSNISLPMSSADYPRLYSYKSGLVTSDTLYLYYLNYDGTVKRKVTLPSYPTVSNDHGEELTSVSLIGTAYLVEPNNTYGTEPNYLAIIQPNGKAKLLDPIGPTINNEGYYGWKALALPDGGVAYDATKSSLEGLSVINADGTIRWQDPSIGYQYGWEVDSLGNLIGIGTTQVKRTIPDANYGVLYNSLKITELSSSSGNTIASATISDANDPMPYDVGADSTSFEWAGVVGSGTVYQEVNEITHDHTSMVDRKLISVPLTGVSGSYPYSAIANAAANPANTRRYLALGDSVPYGHGLSNPGNEAQNGLTPDQPPSTSAYPSLVASTLGLSMQVRTSGCVLTGDQLAVSGAPAAAANVTNSDVDCKSSAPHKSVQADEIPAANLAFNPPYLVTIQAGADDIGFAACLANDLVPNPLEVPCVVKNKPSSNVSNAVAAAKLALIQEIQAVQAVGTKHIGIVNYYQPIPTPAEMALLHISSSNLVCWALALHPMSTYNDAKILLGAVNNMIKQVALQTGATLVNIGAAFKGHEMCTSSPDVFAGDDLTNTLDWRTAHPNQAGQTIIAADVSRVFKGI